MTGSTCRLRKATVETFVVPNISQMQNLDALKYWFHGGQDAKLSARVDCRHGTNMMERDGLTGGAARLRGRHLNVISLLASHELDARHAMHDSRCNPENVLENYSLLTARVAPVEFAMAL